MNMIGKPHELVKKPMKPLAATLAPQRLILTYMLAAIIFTSSWALATTYVTPGAPDQNAITVLKILPEYFPAHTQAMWVNVVDGEDPYLFVMPIDKCGASDCTIVGFQKLSSGWVKVYEVFGGEGLKILDTKTQNHHDIEQYESRGAGSFIIKTSKWNSNRYDNPAVTEPIRPQASQLDKRR
jgi:hypothetical protein